MRRVIWAAIVCEVFLFCAPSWGSVIEFSPKQARISASIKYTVIGQYVAGFDSFKGIIDVDPQTGKILSVLLEIDAQSIRSNCKACDDIVRSQQLLDTARFDKITFKSSAITNEGDGYRVTGILDMHGVQKEMTFPFDAVVTDSEVVGKKDIEINGKWIINRKDFGIIWNRLLDKGGILVGNHITVHWSIKDVI